MKGFLPSFLSFNLDIYSPKAAAKMISKAKESIKIIMPDTIVDFHRDELIVSAIKAAIKRGVVVQIAHHPSSETETAEIFYISGVKVFKIAEPRERLSLSIDGKYSLVQRKRDMGQDHGIIDYQAGKLADEIDIEFNRLVVI